MSFEELMGDVMRMSVDLERLAAAGTYLRSMSQCIELHPDVEPLLRDITELTLPGAVDLPVPQRDNLAGVIISIFRQAADLVDDPAREPGWVFDPTVVQATSRSSIAVAVLLAAVAPQLDGLADRMAGSDGAFLDVGTGAGWLAITAARQWPQATVTGIDVLEASLEMARASVKETGVDDRVTLRNVDVCRLDEDASFDLAWFPGPFIPPSIVPDALAACRRSLRPGGWLAFGVYGGPDSEVASKVSELRTLRSGGRQWTPDESAALLTDAGFEDVRELERTWNAPLRLVVGRRR